MTGLEQKILDFVDHIQHLYFETRDITNFLGFLDTEIEFIGLGVDEICQTADELRQHLEAEKAEFSGSFSILSSECQTCQLTETFCLANGMIQLKENTEYPLIQPFWVRFSALFRETETGEIRIRQMHLSQPSEFQPQGDYFPRVLKDESVEEMKKLLARQSAAVRDQNRNFKVLTDNIPGCVLSYEESPELTLLQYSQGLLAMCGYTAEELKAELHSSFRELILPEDREKVFQEVSSQLEMGNAKEVEYRMLRKDGSVFWVLDRRQRVEREDGSCVYYCILFDVTASKRAQEELQMSLERYQIIMDQATEIIFEWDLRENSVKFSRNWQKKFGYLPEIENASENWPLSKHLYPEDRLLLRETMQRLLSGEKTYSEIELRLADREGRFCWCRVRLTAQCGEDSIPVRVIGVISDIDKEKRAAQALRVRAERDALTGLYNKETTQLMIEQQLQNLEMGNLSAFLILDVDNFKQVNDWFGHLSGDIVLSNIAAALKGLFRSEDIIGRIGGDEFAVFLRNVPDLETIAKKAESILRRFRFDLWKKMTTARFRAV